jgi:hypothetical protein
MQSIYIELLYLQFSEKEILVKIKKNSWLRFYFFDIHFQESDPLGLVSKSIVNYK